MTAFNFVNVVLLQNERTHPSEGLYTGCGLRIQSLAESSNPSFSELALLGKEMPGMAFGPGHQFQEGRERGRGSDSKNLPVNLFWEEESRRLLVKGAPFTGVAYFQPDSYHCPSFTPKRGKHQPPLL